MKQIQKGSLVKAKYDIEIGGATGNILDKIKLGELGIVIDFKLANGRKELHIRFNSGSMWWLTEDELEILSK